MDQLSANDDLDEAWSNFCADNYTNNESNNNSNNNKSNDKLKKSPTQDNNTPKCSDIYISTKTIISYLTSQVNLREVFWKIPIIPYHLPQEGIIKKQMKFNSSSQEEVDNIMEKTKEYSYVNSYNIKRIVNPEGRIKYKDVRKLSIGLCKKDITSYRCKQKEAFYNCFVLEMRFFDKVDNIFKEIHVKVFNTGKLEIPGIKSHATLIQVLTLVTELLRPYMCDDLTYKRDVNETVLINSNFNCGYFINREKLYDKLKYKYKINSAYDPCSYPGIQCKFYYNPELLKQTGRQPNADTDELVMQNIIKMSFMIFRTGSVLIVGKCDEDVLKEIYDFLKNLLEVEFSEVGETIISDNMLKEAHNNKNSRKIRKKTIILEESS